MTDIHDQVKEIYSTLKNSLPRYSTPGLLDLVIKDPEFSGYIHNSPPGSGLYYWFLRRIAAETNAKTIVELGNREGLSTIAIVDGLHEHQEFYSIDIERDLRFVPAFVQNKKNVHLEFGDCVNLKSYSMGVPQNIDVLFCDTIHTFAQVSKEFQTYEPLLSNKAIVLVDDMDLADKRRFADEWSGEMILDSGLHACGFGIFFYER